MKRGDKFKEYDVERSIIHPNYTTELNNKIHDLALLKLAQNVDFNEQVQPACMLLNDTSERLLQSGKKVSIFAAGPSKTGN